MGRLENIIERNRHPRGHRRAMFPISIGLAIFVLLILVLMVFTDLDESPGSGAAPATPAAGPPGPKLEGDGFTPTPGIDEPGRVRGIQLRVQRRDARLPD